MAALEHVVVWGKSLSLSSSDCVALHDLQVTVARERLQVPCQAIRLSEGDMVIKSSTDFVQL